MAKGYVANPGVVAREAIRHRKAPDGAQENTTMNKTPLLIVAALVAVAFVAAAPAASADNVVGCAQRENHFVGHCAFDCTPVSDEGDLFDLDTPLTCRPG